MFYCREILGALAVRHFQDREVELRVR